MRSLSESIVENAALACLEVLDYAVLHGLASAARKLARTYGRGERRS